MEFYQHIRGHWSIENGLHGSLDVVCGEDACRVSKGYAPENLNIVQKVALSLLWAALNPEYQSKKGNEQTKEEVCRCLES